MSFDDTLFNSILVVIIFMFVIGTYAVFIYAPQEAERGFETAKAITASQINNNTTIPEISLLIYYNCETYNSINANAITQCKVKLTDEFIIQKR